jgi:protein tyrosine/serine phosphatase
MTDPDALPHQWIELTGGANTRDLGGLPTVDGHLTRSGALIRSANLQHLTEQDKRLLVTELGVRRVVDLRSDVEVAKEGRGPMFAEASVTIHHLSLLPDSPTVRDDVEQPVEYSGKPGKLPNVLFPGSDRSAPAITDNPIANSYLLLLDTRSDSVIAALRAFAESEGSTVVHCAAGKDRTGLVVALALSLVGVRPEAILADFAASELRIDDVNRLLGLSGTYRPNKSEPLGLKAPKAQVIELVLQTLRESDGGLEGWLGERGWTDKDTDALRAKLVDV